MTGVVALACGAGYAASLLPHEMQRFRPDDGAACGGNIDTSCDHRGL
jgi:hypothetical protein